ncbi:N-acetylmuramoyl-L-alanine amidase [Patulibacter americanus]|uniref:N-acetylmuramoyl-L-alanine amidase n=1 Tax=Patulibacter americanus TaxID=588672 RepID=UPI0003B5F19E|nr:N-acetylmuramoyl-L-alanine amidase [Patulibacter americanus]
MPYVPSPHDRPDATDGAPAPGAGLTRRRVVHAGAAVGAAAVLGSAVPAAATASGRTGRLTVRRAALTPGSTTGPLRAPHRFDLLGAPVDVLHGAGLQIRARAARGRWSAWQSLSGHDGHAPDGRRSRMCDPLWFGDVDEVELRARRRPARDVRLDLVAVDPAAKRAAGRASSRAVARGGADLRPAATRAAGRASTTRAAPTIIPRTAWAAGLTPKGTPDFGQVQVAFVHHTVNGNTYSQEESAGIVRAIFDYHVRSNGWNDIGYNFLVDRFGQIFEGRAGGIDQAVIGAQAVGWNSVSTGIAIIGTFENTPAPEPALRAVASIIGWKLPLHGVPTAGTVSLVSSGGSGNRWKSGATVAMNRISGHQDGCSTDCPGASLYGQLPALRSRVGTVEPAPVATAGLQIEEPDFAVKYGETTTVTGRVEGATVAGVTVVLDKRSPTGKWVPLAQTTTDGSGAWSVGFPLRSATAVRARTEAVTSTAVTPALDPGLEVTPPTGRTRAGGTLLVRGRARGVREAKIVLRRKVRGRYVVVASKTVRVKNGRFSGRLPVRRAGMHNVSVQATSGGRNYRSASRFTRAR